MVRIVVTIVLALALGVGLGAAQFSAMHAGYEERMGQWISTGESVSKSPEATPAATQSTGKEPRVVVVGGAKHDFGEMQQGSHKTHTFTFRNEGTAPLTLAVAGSSCRCTIGTLKDSVLEPGEETGVLLDWKATGVLDKFGQTATITTNDPTHPEVVLSVQGFVKRVFMFEPETLALNDVSVTEPLTRKVMMFSYLEQPVEIQKLEWSEPKTADKVHLDYKSVPVGDDRYPQHAKAVSAAEIEVKIDPGLPMGAFDQRVQIKLNTDAIEELTYNVTGTVVGDIGIVAGPNFDTDRRVFNIGRVSSAEGYESKFHLSVQGEHRQDVKIEIAEVIPSDALNVTIGEPIVRSNRVLFPIICTVPKNAPKVSFPGTNPGNFGKIIIHSTHPNIPKVPIAVRMTVE